MNVAVSILPQQTFVQKIGKERVHVTLMVPPGTSPHTYEPKASQMKALSKVAVYLAIDVEFESAWLPRFRDVNPAMQVFDTTAGIAKIEMDDEDEPEEEAHGHHHEHLDPHVWLSPPLAAVIARNTCDALVRVDPEGEGEYRANLKGLLDEIAETDRRIKRILKGVPNGSRFMVVHPSWGYFAQTYHLKQLAMEAGGKEPTPKTLIRLIDTARKEHVRAIIVQPEFSDKSARVLADALGIAVKKRSPLAADWSENLIELAVDIAK